LVPLDQHGELFTSAEDGDAEQTEVALRRAVVHQSHHSERGFVIGPDEPEELMPGIAGTIDQYPVGGRTVAVGLAVPQAPGPSASRLGDQGYRRREERHRPGERPVAEGEE